MPFQKYQGSAIVVRCPIIEKMSFLVLTSGKFLEALGSAIGTSLVFCNSFSVSNNVMKLCNFINENLFSLVS